MARLFGTDGVRGLANKDITARLALDLGVAAARELVASGATYGAGERPRAIVGRDTRVSGEMLSAAVCAGLTSAGVDVHDVGVLPTPGIAHLTATSDVDLGVVISASHNAMPDNGIKFFARGGYKLDDAVEDRIESVLGDAFDAPVGDGLGRLERASTLASSTYIDHLVGAVSSTPLKGLRVAVDCANGAASDIAPAALREAGADVVVLNASPDGYNINDACGSTHPEQLQAVTVAAGAAFGVAFDGDADRCLAVDGEGRLVDGDQILGILATDLHERGELTGDTLVVTVMSNLGLLIAMEKAGIATVQTGVGDRYVLEAMRAGGFALGGEQSGHIISSSHASTGDGVLTALLLAARAVQTGRTLAELASVVTRLPQVLLNVKGVDRTRATTDDGVVAAVTEAESRLGGGGRVLLRPSGTEPVVRVMVEAGTEDEARREAETLAEVVSDRLALTV